jgi:hypothetical protein
MKYGVCRGIGLAFALAFHPFGQCTERQLENSLSALPRFATLSGDLPDLRGALLIDRPRQSTPKDRLPGSDRNLPSRKMKPESKPGFPSPVLTISLHVFC